MTDARSPKITTVIVDDEPLARSNLAVLLRRDPTIDIAAECGSGVEAPAVIRRAKPDLLFLDVQMPECDGFDVLELLGKDLPPAIIFTTAYDQYALRAFEAGALDYLLKPFDDARFALALERARQKIAVSRDAPRRLERLTIKSAGQIVFLKLSEIDWIEAADYYACLHVGQRTHMLRRSIVDLEQDLDPSAFCRIHRSTIVNLDRIAGLSVTEDGGYDVVLHNDIRLRLSRSYRRQLEDRMGIRNTCAP
ncbi:LytR/AlgR family response regulator transcription factor [Edaphobacter aggregans]|uniref:LytR/AlgR family response regulator transcription factor n=1 Tax=Edaphobacter aggregans TaxID=570835 RepID=UPI00054E26DF|nr:response regulator [Edaphobacter aggregans]